MAYNCVFCQIVQGQLPASVAYEDDTVIAFMDIMPINPGHVLVVPKTHFTELSDMDEDTGAQLFSVAMKIERALRKAGIRCEGINLMQNNGAAAFQEVMHVHLHVIPRYRGDGVSVHFGQQKATRESLDQIAKQIKTNLPNET